MVKENVKAALSENKQLISASFAALIQTLKADPEMVNLILKLPVTKDDKEHKDDNNDNAIKYLECNKDNLSELVERHYENLVETLTNNAIDAAATSPSPTFSLLQSSFIFSSP